MSKAHFLQSMIVAGAFHLAASGVAAQGPPQGPLLPQSANGAVSGETRSQQINRVGLGTNSQVAYGISVAERSDDPCWVTVHRRILPGSSVRHPAWAGCDNPTLRSDKKVEAPQGQFIIGVRMCKRGGNGNRQNLLKGVQIRTARVNNQGQLQATGTRKFERPNCRAWARWSNCSAGSVVTGVNVHARALGGRNVAVGLQAVCQALRQT